MSREPERGGLLRLEKERLFAEGVSDTVTALSRDDQRQDSGFGSEFLDHAFGSGHKGDRLTDDRTRRLNLRSFPKRRWKQHCIKGTPGKERLSINLKVMARRMECHTPPHDIALLVELGIWHMHQALLQFILTHLKRRSKHGFCERLPPCHLMHNREAEFILRTLQVCD